MSSRRRVPVSRDGSESVDTHIGQAGRGWRALVPPDTRPTVRDGLLLFGVGRAPESVRRHLVDTLAAEGITTELEVRGDDLHLTMTGPADAVRGALVTVPRIVRALRR